MKLADCMEVIKKTNIDAKKWDVQLIVGGSKESAASVFDYSFMADNLNSLYINWLKGRIPVPSNTRILSMTFAGCGQAMIVDSASLEAMTLNEFMDMLHCSRFEIVIGIEDAEEKEQCKIVLAEFTSVWDDGIAITTKCKVNMATREVFDIEPSEDTADLVNELTGEYITFPDGEEKEVIPYQDEDWSGFWYDGE